MKYLIQFRSVLQSLALSILLCIPGLAKGQEAEVPIHITFENTRFKNNKESKEIIHSIVKEELDPELDPEQYVQADVDIAPNSDDQYTFLLAYLKLRHSYGLRIARITLDWVLDVQFTEWDVLPMRHEIRSPLPSSGENQPTCPDESIGVVFATVETGIKSAVDGVTQAAISASDAGYNTKTLKGSAASVEAYKNWLSCKNLIAFGNIGHGYPNGIQLANRKTLTAAWFQSLSANFLEEKIIYFNSCQVHKNPLEPAIIAAGASRYIGGDVDLMIGPSERVFKAFWKDVLNNEPEDDQVTQVLRKHEKQLYPRKNAHGISGDGEMPWNKKGPAIDLKLVEISGGLLDIDLPITLLINDEKVSVDEQGFWKIKIPLAQGQNNIKVVSFDISGNKSTRSLKVDVKFP